jgi:hypothetical protein
MSTASASGRVSACPKHLWGQVKVEADVSDRYVDIVEVRPPWNGIGEQRSGDAIFWG